MASALWTRALACPDVHATGCSAPRCHARWVSAVGARSCTIAERIAASAMLVQPVTQLPSGSQLSIVQSINHIFVRQVIIVKAFQCIPGATTSHIALAR